MNTDTQNNEVAPKMTTDTPRTDAAKKDDWVHYTIAMMLERDWNVYKAEVERLKGSLKAWTTID